MAEAIAVIGLISATTQLSELGIKVVKRLGEFVSAVNGTPDFVTSIRVRLVLLGQALENVRGQAVKGLIDPSSAQSLSEVVTSTLTRVQTLGTLLDKAAPHRSFSTFEKRINAVRSLSYDRKMQKILDQLQGDVQLLTFSLVSGIGGRGVQDIPQPNTQAIAGTPTTTKLHEITQTGQICLSTLRQKD